MSWVIVGDGSGPYARPLKPEWIHQIREKCQAVDVPSFFRQWGGRTVKVDSRLLGGVGYDGIPKVSVGSNHGVLMAPDPRRDEINLDLSRHSAAM